MATVVSVNPLGTLPLPWTSNQSQRACQCVDFFLQHRLWASPDMQLPAVITLFHTGLTSIGHCSALSSCQTSGLARIAGGCLPICFSFNNQ